MKKDEIMQLKKKITDLEVDIKTREKIVELSNNDGWKELHYQLMRGIDNHTKILLNLDIKELRQNPNIVIDKIQEIQNIKCIANIVKENNKIIESQSDILKTLKDKLSNIDIKSLRFSSKRFEY